MYGNVLRVGTSVPFIEALGVVLGSEAEIGLDGCGI